MGQMLSSDAGAAPAKISSYESEERSDAPTQLRRGLAETALSRGTPKRSMSMTRYLVKSITKSARRATSSILLGSSASKQRRDSAKWHLATVWSTPYSTTEKYVLKKKRCSHIFECCGEQWVLEFYGGGFRTESNDHVGLYLRYLGNAKCVELRFRLSIVVGERLDAVFFSFTSPLAFLGKTAMHQEKIFTNWGTARLCPQHCIVDPEGGILLNGNITLRCDIQFAGEREVVSATNPLLARTNVTPGSSKRSSSERQRQPLGTQSTNTAATAAATAPLSNPAAASSTPKKAATTWNPISPREKKSPTSGIIDQKSPTSGIVDPSTREAPPSSSSSKSENSVSRQSPARPTSEI